MKELTPEEVDRLLRERLTAEQYRRLLRKLNWLDAVEGQLDLSLQSLAEAQYVAEQDPDEDDQAVALQTLDVLDQFVIRWGAFVSEVRDAIVDAYTYSG